MLGTVSKSTGKEYDVIADDGLKYRCSIRGKIRLEGRSTTNPVAAGDRVVVEVEKDLEAIITSILPRKNYIIRKSVNLSKEAQVIAANLDQAFLFVTLFRPQTTFGFIDRFLVTADAYDIPVTVVFSKIDQYNSSELEVVSEVQSKYDSIGYPSESLSLNDMTSVNRLSALLDCKTSLISGHSATGKTSFINALIPDLDLRVGDISEASGKGQHSTTFAEMFALPNSGFILDTPGIKGFGLVDIPKDELHHHFP
ncbi:MAG: ribosome small subunit-dependent GTPase A, partial [Flavobacteriales bacterium]